MHPPEQINIAVPVYKNCHLNCSKIADNSKGTVKIDAFWLIFRGSIHFKTHLKAVYLSKTKMLYSNMRQGCAYLPPSNTI